MIPSSRRRTAPGWPEPDRGSERLGDEEGLGMKLRTMIVVVAGICVATTAAGGGATVAKQARFVNFGFASTPPAPAGTVCPGSRNCWNVAAEPQIRADGAGTFYVSSENGLLRGTIA